MKTVIARQYPTATSERLPMGESSIERFWRSDDRKLAIRLREGDDEIGVTLKYLHHEVYCVIKFGYDHGYLSVRDLNGCNHQSGIHRMGFGTLTVNTALQSVLPRLLIQAPISSSPLRDPTDYVVGAPHLEETTKNRIAFWRQFNFHIGPPDEKGTYYLSGRAGDLRFVTAGMAGPKREYPRFISLDRFVSPEQAILKKMLPF